MEGIMLLILVGTLVVECLVICGALAWEAFNFVMDKWYYWGAGRDKIYRENFREWFEKGNRILKTKKITFVLTYYDSGGLGVFCNSEKCYRFNLSEVEIGRIISKKRIPLLHKMIGDLEDISKEKFVDELITSDSIFHSRWYINNTGTSKFVFSFDTIDMDKLPDWVTTELVAKKLAES